MVVEGKTVLISNKNSVQSVLSDTEKVQSGHKDRKKNENVCSEISQEYWPWSHLFEDETTIKALSKY